MDKIRIALFGISDGIMNAIKREIDPSKTEIVLFLDNDAMKQEVCYMNIPVVKPSETLMRDYAIDYILITALSAFESIRDQLTNLGVSKDKIQVFVANDLWKYCVGSIDDINVELIRYIYFQPQKTLETIAKYKEIYNIYSMFFPFEEEVDTWFGKSNMVAHACGGIVNGRQVMYSNSKEAFQYSMEKGFKIIECDLMRVENELILAHDYGCFYESSQEKYSMMKAREILMLLKKVKEVSCIIDVKWNDYGDYAFCVNQIDDLIEKIADNDMDRYALKEQLVMEVYDEETIKIAKDKGFSMIFTQYRNAEWECFMNTANLCYKYGVRVVAMAADWCLSMTKFINILTDKNIKIFAYSTDDIDEYSLLRKMNVTSVFTNYLTKNDIMKF